MSLSKRDQIEAHAGMMPTVKCVRIVSRLLEEKGRQPRWIPALKVSK